jgi:hypothetical protein
MRKVEILDVEGNVVGTQEMEDSIAPALLQGQTYRVVEVDGVPVGIPAVHGLDEQA